MSTFSLQVRPCPLLRLCVAGLGASLVFSSPPTFGFEGRINAVLTRGGDLQTFRHTIGTNTMKILGYDCTRNDLKQRGEVMEIWATDEPLPCRPFKP